MLLDLDHFKQVNDKYGHVAGDIVLTEVSARLKANLRHIDLISRFGGEEFLAILTDTTKERAVIVAERLRRLIQEQPVCLADGTNIQVTVSIGMALSDANSAQCAAMLKDADGALYASKAEGRNLVTIASSRTAA
ncbi:two component diguanylate cyclase [Rhodobacteraceae bacterium HTCC2150]|nr:two component diguanylate cyclase [Rhodobacteraceae bacterium HTCC2150]